MTEKNQELEDLLEDLEADQEKEVTDRQDTLLNLVDLGAREFAGEDKANQKEIETLEAKRQVSKALMDQIDGLPKLLKDIAIDYLTHQNYPALRQLCKDNEYDYEKVKKAIVKERKKEDGADFMAILLEVEAEMDKSRGPLVRALLFEKAVGEQNLAAADLFLKHMKKETKQDKRAILTTIELPDPDG